MTAANLITLLRLAALPVVIVLLRQGQTLAAGLVFLAAMLTDAFDGYVARRMGQVSRLGLYLDPVVDKILVLGLLYELAHARLLHPAIPHLLLARELLHNGVRAAAAKAGTVVGANWMGKTKAVLQTVLITWALLLPAAASHLPEGRYRSLYKALQAYAWCVLLVACAFFIRFAWKNRALLRGPVAAQPSPGSPMD